MVFIWLRTPRDSLLVRHQRREMNAWSEKERRMCRFLSYCYAFVPSRLIASFDLPVLMKIYKILVEYLSAGERKQRKGVWDGRSPRYIFLSVRSTFHFDSAQHLGRSPSIGESEAWKRKRQMRRFPLERSSGSYRSRSR